MTSQTAPATPTTLSGMSATALQIKAYNTKLRVESIINDVFEKLSAVIDYSEKGANVPEAIFMKLEKTVTGAHSVVVPLVMRLNEAPTYGRDTLVGNEESLRLRHMTVYYNLIRKAVATEQYGPDANDVSAYDLYGQIGPQMTDYFSELRGKRIREASLLTVAEELVQAPASQAHRFNSNIFIPNTALGGMPVFDTRALTEGSGATYPDLDTLADNSGSHVSNICSALKTATNDWANPEYAEISVESLLALDYHCVENLGIEPIMVGGQATMVFTIPSTQMIKLLNPTSSTQNIGTIWKEVMALQKVEQMIPGAYCRVRHLLLVEDTRYATITVAGDATTPSWTITPGFLQPGNADGRNLSPFNASTNLVFDVGCVYGKGALVEWIVQPLKYATEVYDYEMLKGKGAYQCAGIQLAMFNIDATTGDQYATNYQKSSCIVLMSKPSLVTVS